MTLVLYTPGQTTTLPYSGAASTAAWIEEKAAVRQDQSGAPALPPGATYTVAGLALAAVAKAPDTDITPPARPIALA